MDCLENFGLNRDIIKLVLPLGATMNMNGTALLEGVASITIAQMANCPLTFVQILVIRLIIKTILTINVIYNDYETHIFL